jgi:ABC-type antimicrobial peptide transport system permease subunit
MHDTPQNSHLRFDFLASFATLTVPGNARGDFLYGANLNDMTIFGLNPQVYTYLLFRPNYTPEQFEQTIPAFLQKYLGSQLQRLGLELNPILQPLSSIRLRSHLDAEVSPNSDINTVYIFLAVSGFILLIACINFMNLATARSANRAKEVGIRKILGAAEGQIVFLLSKEFVVLVLLANLVAWPIAYWAMHNWLQDFAYRTSLQWDIFIFGGIVALLISLLTVSFQAIKAAVANPIEALRYE